MVLRTTNCNTNIQLCPVHTVWAIFLSLETYHDLKDSDSNDKKLASFTYDTFSCLL